VSEITARGCSAAAFIVSGIARAECRQAIDWPSRSRTVASTEGVRRSDCLHGDIHEMSEVRWFRIGN